MVINSGHTQLIVNIDCVSSYTPPTPVCHFSLPWVSLASTVVRESSGVERLFLQFSVSVLLPAACFTFNCVLFFPSLTVSILTPGLKKKAYIKQYQ